MVLINLEFNFRYPFCRYRWLKDGADLEINGQYRYETPGEDGTIIIEEANRFLNNGKYQCIATNQHGVALSGVSNVEQTSKPIENQIKV